MVMKKGYNRATLEGILSLWLEASTKTIKDIDKPCVFLSHKNEDKSECRVIAEYLSEAGIDYYLDEEDDDLQQAVNSGNPKLITERIKKGIKESSHMLVVVSKKTFESQWVPFEVGYGHAAIIDGSMQSNESVDKIKLSILTLKDISEKKLPAFMKLGNIVRGTKSLNEYISKITQESESILLRESRIYPNNKSEHPLNNILNWKM